MWQFWKLSLKVTFFSRVLPHQKTRSSAALIFRPTLVVLLHRCQRRRRLLRVRHPLGNSGQWSESRQSSWTALTRWETSLEVRKAKSLDTVLYKNSVWLSYYVTKIYKWRRLSTEVANRLLISHPGFESRRSRKLFENFQHCVPALSNPKLGISEMRKSASHKFVCWSIKPRIILADIMRLLEIIGLVEFAKLRMRHFFFS